MTHNLFFTTLPAFPNAVVQANQQLLSGRLPERHQGRPDRTDLVNVTITFLCYRSFNYLAF